jgi:glutamyl-Q tRNA(Asp) synthetase
VKSSTATGTTATAESAGRAPVPRPCGRFAPSPTGPLHLGSLLAAIGSWVDARAAGGEWRVRIEDVDRAREVPGAADDMLRTLERFGLTWDGPVVRQSARGEFYAAALARLEADGRAYPCTCTRAGLETGSGGELRYPGLCRGGPRQPTGPSAMRMRVDGLAAVTVEDRVQGSFTQDVDAAVGDFVLRRRDGFWSYQLAVVVDDGAHHITDVVRGLDLFDNTPRQRLLQDALGLPTPRYLHLPVVVTPDGEKLAKSRQALPVAAAKAAHVMTRVLGLLRHTPPAVLHNAPVGEQLRWATESWDVKLLQGVTHVISNA